MNTITNSPESTTIFQALFTRENITLFLSIFGSLGTLITFISAYLTKRKNLKIKISSPTYSLNLQKLMLSLSFENYSHLPLAITAISININNNAFLPSRYPQCVGEYIHRRGKEIIDRKFEYNLKLPADIAQLSAISGVILFDVSPKELENLSTPLILRVLSTRGKEQKIVLQPDQIKWT